MRAIIAEKVGGGRDWIAVDCRVGVVTEPGHFYLAPGDVVLYDDADRPPFVQPAAGYNLLVAKAGDSNTTEG